MIACAVPGFGELRLEHLVLDHNGTLALDGRLLPGVGEALTGLAGKLEVHVLTADTFGLAAEQLSGLPVVLTILPRERQEEGKRDFIRRLGAGSCVCIGNGRNDRLMLAAAALGIAVILGEGAAAATLAAADIVCCDILAALALLDHPLRLTATLRS
jgi:soluble P-type ATPase